MIAMSVRGDNEKENVIRFESRRIERGVPGLGAAVFRVPGADAEMRLAHFYDDEAPDHHVFVSELIAVALESPEVDVARVEGLSERARAIARVAVAEVTGCTRDYRRHVGSGMEGDERLFHAMRARHDRQLEQLRLAAAAMNENVVRMVERARKAVIQSGAVEYLERNQRQFEQLAETHTRAMRPAYLGQLERLNRQMEGLLRPPVLEGLARQQNALNSFATGYTRMAENLARQLEQVVRPRYFGAIEQMSRQISDVARPRYLDSMTRLIEQMQEVIRPRYFDQFASLGRQLQELSRAPLVESLRERLAAGLETYAAWVERNWAQIYADPDHPPPVMFLLAALPMAVGLPLLRALQKDDEPLLVRLEAALEVDALQAAVHASPELDQVGKRHLVQGLEWLRTGQYVDAAPPLYHGLERAFKAVARRRGIIDGQNKFLVPARRRKARSVDDLFEHLDLDKRYLRYVRSWVFGEWGNLARHGDLPEPEHRRWTLRAVVALIGWFEYCGADDAPMNALVQRLEIAASSQEHTA
jgi:hypothetical protein